VACPYFAPLQASATSQWHIPPRSPLGHLFDGECLAQSPPSAADHPACNFGYARGLCPHFPPDAKIDAVRYWRTADTLYFVEERDHLPIRWGTKGV
jgi:hypothetical protein